MQSTGLMVFWFVVVLALIPASLWLLKRSGWTPKTPATDVHAMRTLSQLGLGPGQRIVTVEVGQGPDAARLVLGVTAHSIQTLHVLSPGSATPTTASVPSFAQALASSRQSVSGDAA